MRAFYHHSIIILKKRPLSITDSSTKEDPMKYLDKQHVTEYLSFFAIVIAAWLISSCAGLPREPLIKTPPPFSWHTNIPSHTGQVLLVAEESILCFTLTRVYFLEKTNGEWTQTMEPLRAVIGKNGFAAPGEKREGDGKTPSGLFRLGTAFGYPEKVDTKMPYRQALNDDIWVDDPEAADYNRWVKKEQTQANSYETLKRDDPLYEYAIVIEYNTDPVIKGHGSAIFLHIRAGYGEPTAGCVAVSKENMLRLLSRLDPEKQPVILINPDQ